MSQIHTQWSHFLRLVVTVGFDDISLENYGQLIIHIIIVMFIMEYAIRGSAEMSQIHTQWSHFLRLVITVDFYDIPLERMVS